MSTMEKELVSSIEELSLAMKNDVRVLELEKREKEALDDEEVMALVKRKDAMESNYSLILSYKKEDSEEAKKAQKELYEAKLALDEHPLVKRYNESFSLVRDLYMNIDDIIFSPYRRKSLF
ncbi:MAG: YlbF family regulator [Bacilli bacterium]|nr:YlbF family regulator [Bacilli bacterium]